MIRPAGAARKYRVSVRGECGSLLASLLDNVQVAVSSETGDTSVVAWVRDDPEFWRLIDQLQDLALHVVSVQDLDQGNGQASASSGRVSAHKWLSQNADWLPLGVP
jgi:hypothetical protein